MPFLAIIRARAVAAPARLGCIRLNRCADGQDRAEREREGTGADRREQTKVRPCARPRRSASALFFLCRSCPPFVTVLFDPFDRD